MRHIFDFILIGAFVAYVMFDYVKSKNKLKLLFLIPVLLSYPMLTSWPGTITEQQFFYYRMTLIASCFLVGFIYITGNRKREKRIAAGTEEKRLEAKQAAKEAKQGSKGKQVQNPSKNKAKKRR